MGEKRIATSNRAAADPTHRSDIRVKVLEMAKGRPPRAPRRDCLCRCAKCPRFCCSRLARRSPHAPPLRSGLNCLHSRNRQAAGARKTEQLRLGLLPDGCLGPSFSSQRASKMESMLTGAVVLPEPQRQAGGDSRSVGGPRCEDCPFLGPALHPIPAGVSMGNIRQRSVRRHNASEQRRILRPPRSARVALWRCSIPRGA